ncbi:hypothetical protein PR048_029955 [Dryococelus australis]|uniref:DUF4371 domain-containing protein n=1 Tax=Dryococelus australis TaxID=614101 RepID=A0ABQ9GBH0_9NEOP|nr:hypothetical protein PR048_029955 [Dryococelus australis]
MKRQQQQVTDFFQRKSKCIENRDDSASDVNVSDSECKCFCSEVKGTVLITDCKPDPASTSSNNSKGDAVRIRDRESTSLCTEDLGAVLLSYYKSDIATADIIGTSSSPSASVDPTFIVSGYCNWKKASEKYSYHENCESHKGSEEALLAFNQKPVSARLSAQVSKEMEKRHNRLSCDIQNVILQLLSLTVVCNLNQDIKKNKYFALIVDETTENSTKEKVSISLRHVNDDFDDFIGLYETSSTMGDTLAAIIEDVLLRLDLPIEDNRGQCYDVATARTPLAVISSKENRAIYMHCFSHSLKLALIHASSTVSEILNVLENVHTLAKCFNESDKRTTSFLNYKAVDDTALAKNTTLKPLCHTRWIVRSKSLNVVNSQYETILSALDSLKYKESVANGLSAFFEKTSSSFYLKVSVIVFGITEELARNMQTSDISIKSTLRQMEIVMGSLTDLRTGEKFTELWEKSSNGEVENIRDQVLQICEHLKGDLNVEKSTRQLAMLTELTAGRKINSFHGVLDSIRREQSQTRRLFSEVCTCLGLLLILPATSA